MHYWLILASILLGLAAGQRVAYPYTLFGTCSYTGDPHLRPFPTKPGEVTNQYFCSTIGWQILLENQWVLIAVQVGPSPYIISDYVVFFFNADSSLACVLIGSSGLSTCPTSSPIASTIISGGSSWNHLYPVAQYFNLQISSYAWGSGKRYDFYIRETFALIGQSTGLCVKFDCPLEQIIYQPPPIVIQLCGIYVDAAQKQAVGPVNEVGVRFINVACQNDVTLSFDLQFVQTAVARVIYSSLDQIAGEKYQTAIIKAGNSIQTAVQQAYNSAANITQTDACFDQRRCLINVN